MKIFTYGVIGIVAVAVVAGFFIVGSPEGERMRRMDQTREQDLSMIQSEITFFWQSKERLPGMLSELNNELRNIVIPSDPVTKAAYEYRVLGEKKFELCATFSLPSITLEPTTDAPAVPVGESQTASRGRWWDGGLLHGAGRVCFEREIDPDFFPPIRKN